MLRTDLDFTKNYVERTVRYVDPSCNWDGTPVHGRVSGRDKLYGERKLLAYYI